MSGGQAAAQVREIADHFDYRTHRPGSEKHPVSEPRAEKPQLTANVNYMEGMSALGQERTSRKLCWTSALGQQRTLMRECCKVRSGARSGCT